MSEHDEINECGKVKAPADVSSAAAYSRFVLEDRRRELEYGFWGVNDLLAEAEGLAMSLQDTVRAIRDKRRYIREIDEALEQIG